VCDTVAHLDVDRFEQAALEFIRENEISQVEALVQSLNIPAISTAYQLYKAQPSHDTSQKVLTTVRHHIEYAGGFTESRMVRLPTGEPFRERVSVTPLISGGTINTLETGTIAVGGKPSMKFGETVDFGRWAGLANDEELLDKVKNEDLNQLTHLQRLAALYVVLQQHPDLMAVEKSDAASLGGNAVVQPLLGSRAYGSTVEYSRSRRIGNKMGRMGVALLLGSMLGLGANTAVEQADIRETARIDRLYEDGSMRKDAEDPSVTRRIDRMVLNADGTLANVRDAYTGFLARYIVNELGLPSDIGDFIDSNFSNNDYIEWTRRVGLSSPEHAVRPSSEMFIGDGPTTNQALYQVTPLTGGTSAGYYYTETYDTMGLMLSSSPPLDGGTITYSSMKIPKHHTLDKVFPHSRDILAQHPDFMIETPYIQIFKRSLSGVSGGNSTEIALPIRADMSLVGAMIVDAQNPAIEVPISVAQSNADGTLVAHMSNEIEGKLHDLGAEHPVLRYWTKQTMDTSNIWTSKKRLYAESYLYDLEIGETISQRERDEVAASVRNDLGLPSDASLADIYHAVQDGHEYAFLPFQREGDTHKIDTDSEVGMLQQIGRILAKRKTLNCNLAATLTTLATLDTGNAQLASGFMEDGDGTIGTVESHVWLVDTSNSQIIETTPSNLAEGEEKPPLESFAQHAASKNPSSAGLLADAAGAAILLAVAWRRRQKISELVDTARAHASLSGRYNELRINQREYALWGNPDVPYSPTLEHNKTETLQRAALRYIRNFPEGGDAGLLGSLNRKSIYRVATRKK